MSHTYVENPLLSEMSLPPFNSVEAKHIQPAVEQLLEQGREQIRALSLQLANGQISWETLVEPLDEMDDRLSQVWSTVSHLNSVLSNDHWRDAHNACLPLLSKYSTELKQNRTLFNAYQQLANSKSFASLSDDKQKVIEITLRDFRLAGVDLPEKDKKRYGEIRQQLSTLSSQFSDNVLDATQLWTRHFESSQLLQGLPESALTAMAESAQKKDLRGYLVSLEPPSYLAMMTYCDNRKLREEIYYAYQTRASDQGPHAGKYNNMEIITSTLKLRQEMAQLLGFNNYADYSFATKMAESPDQVCSFLEELADKSINAAKKDWKELQDYCQTYFKIKELQPWDLSYYSEKMRHQLYAISQEELRVYFPVTKVLQGLFNITERLFEIEIFEDATETLWHSDVGFYRVERKGKVLAHFYIDLYARSNKRGGAWMTDFRCRRRQSNGDIQLPVAYLTCNFDGPVGNDPALLKHNEVTTLFHEFGHGLHHMLTQVETLAISGINGVPWDVVELPSQFMENWCWQNEGLAMISSHYKSGEILPVILLNQLLAAKNFQSGMQMLRQLEFSLFDLYIHKNAGIVSYQQAHQVLNKIRKQVSVIPITTYNRFENSFSHVFAGGYAAGYYSYKWAEVLSADAFSRFEQEGIFNQQTGKDFLQHILERGGSVEPMVLFKRFRGRLPNTDALLKHSGLIT